MQNHLWAWACVLAWLSLSASGQDWKAKQYADWTDDDAKQVLTDSPWAKATTPTRIVTATPDISPRPKRRRRRGTEQAAKPAEGAADKNAVDKVDKKNAAALPKLSVRWESAQPTQEAERRASSVAVQGANPTLSPSDVEPNRYVIAVYGVPGSLLALRTEANSKKADAKRKAQTRKLKKLAFIKSAGRRDLPASSVIIRVEGDNAVVVYTFSKKDEIDWREHKLNFEAQIADLKVLQTFNTDDMTLHGKLEL